MVNAQQHLDAADELLALAEDKVRGHPVTRELIARAQVHATMALVYATAHGSLR